MPVRLLPDTDILVGYFRSAGVERVAVSFLVDDSEAIRLPKTVATDAAGARVTLTGPARRMANIVRRLVADMLEEATFRPPWPLYELAQGPLETGALDTAAARHRRPKRPWRWSPQCGDHGILTIDLAGGRPSIRLALSICADLRERASFEFRGAA
jgi:hypothetical protein